MEQGKRYRIDDLRRLATDVATRAGLDPSKAAILAKHLLWFDAIGAQPFGIKNLPTWLSRLGSGEFDPKTCGTVGLEHASTVVLDGRRGLPPLVLARAAEIAGQKARDTGMGLVRIHDLSACGPTAPAAAELAIGPLAGLIFGPDTAQASAFPSTEGLPLVHDSQLDGAASPLVSPWAVLAGPNEVVVVAVAIAAVEPLSTFQERVDDGLNRLWPSGSDPGPGWLLPQGWERRRSRNHEHGVSLAPEVEGELRQWAERSHVVFPAPSSG